MNGIWWAALAAGTVLTLPKKQGHNVMKLPSFRGVAEVRSSLPGRLRLNVPDVSANMEQAEQMKSRLEGTGVIRSVAVEPRTGSVLICYDEKAVQGAVVLGAVIKLMGLDESVRRPPVSKAFEGMQTLFGAVNAGILDATDGMLDASTLAAGALTLAALHSKMKSGWAMPGAMTLLWWASRLFGAQNHE